MRYIALLRGINVGGKRKILMVDLRQSFERSGFHNVVTYIQTGNILFDSSDIEDSLDLAQRIEQLILSDFGFEVPVIIRMVDELEDIIQKNPFLQESNLQIENLHLTFLKSIPESDELDKMKALSFPRDKYTIVDNNVYLFIPGPYRETKLGNNLFEKKLKVAASTRNWKTILKLSELSNSLI